MVTDGAGKTVFDHVLKPGDIYKVPNKPGLSLTTGNGSGIVLVLDGVDLPKVGFGRAAFVVTRHTALTPQRPTESLTRRRNNLGMNWAAYMSADHSEEAQAYRPWRQIARRKSRQIKVGNVLVGGDAPISVQSMTNTLTSDAQGDDRANSPARRRRAPISCACRAPMKNRPRR